MEKPFQNRNHFGMQKRLMTIHGVHPKVQTRECDEDAVSIGRGEMSRAA